MNTGVVSSRYAKALLRLVTETGRGEQVCAQVRLLLSDPDAAVSQGLEPEIEQLVKVLSANGRTDQLRRILLAFVPMYYRSVGEVLAHLTMASPVEGLPEKIQQLLEAQTGLRVLMETEIDPGIIGGFVLSVDGRLLDESVQGRLDKIRRELLRHNAKRIV